MTWTHPFGEHQSPLTIHAQTLLGGKGSSLHALVRAGFSVPPGFTIATTACREYFDHNREFPPGLEDEVRRRVGELEQRVKQYYGAHNRQSLDPLLLALRSGSRQSMPGMMDTILFCGLNPEIIRKSASPQPLWRGYARFLRCFAASVSGVAIEAPSSKAEPDAATSDCGRLRDRLRSLGILPPDEPWKQLLRCIGAVFDSWHSPRAIAYRQARGLDHHEGTAVNIQTMFISQIAGVLFSRRPQDPSSPWMLIEAVRGDGDRLVGGKITPATILIHRQTRDLQHKNEHESERSAEGGQPIEMDEIDWHGLADLGLRIEQLYGGEVDVEWGWSEGRFVVFQARRQQSSAPPSLVESVRNREVERLRKIAENGTKTLVRHSLTETLPAPTPLTWDVTRRWMSKTGGFGGVYRSLGYAPSNRNGQPGFLELAFGRIYADPSRQAELFGAGYGRNSPLDYDLEALAGEPELLRGPPNRLDIDRLSSSFLWRLPSIVWRSCKVRRRIDRLSKTADREFLERTAPSFVEIIGQERSHKLANESLAEVWSHFDRRRRIILDEFAPQLLLPGVLGAIAFSVAQQELADVLGHEAGGVLVRQLTAGLECDVQHFFGPNSQCRAKLPPAHFMGQQTLLFDVSQGRTTPAEFLEAHGHRGDYEMELSAPRWRETPQIVERLAVALRASSARDPRELRREAVELRQAARRDLPRQLAGGGGRTFLRWVEPLLETASRLMPFREIGKHFFMMGYELLRQALEEIAQRTELGPRLYFTHIDELQRHLTSSWQAGSIPDDLVERRRRHWIQRQRIHAPAVMQLDRLDQFAEPDQAPLQTRKGGSAGPRRLAAVSLSGGVAQGPVKLADEAHGDPLDLGAQPASGFVLVCRTLDPGHVPLLLSASAMIVERGGALSHGAVIARQFGIPAVAYPKATSKFTANDWVKVDGDRGAIHLGQPRNGQ